VAGFQSMVTGPPCKRVFARSNRAPATFSSRVSLTAAAKRLLPVGPRASEDGSDRSPLHGKAQIAPTAFLLRLGGLSVAVSRPWSGERGLPECGAEYYLSAA